MTSDEGQSLVLKDVTRVTDLNMNLLSVSKVCDKNCVVGFDMENNLFVDNKKTKQVIG